ncbi:MAG: hypothetical protein IPN68_17460 [Bacteroidetes bacterium]|nr:hypothetical protein [Bacteroidota bacterium]
MITLKLFHVRYLPSELESGLLYFSEEYGIAGHLCPCGCGSKIITPIGPTDWSLEEKDGKATLYPSIGNWQIPCRSHYWIIKGRIKWSYQFTDDQIRLGRRNEEERAIAYYKKLDNKRRKKTIFWRIVNSIFKK